MAGESKANVIPLRANSGRTTAARRAVQRAESARRHPSLLTDPGGRASAEDIAAVVREIDQHRANGSGSLAEDSPNELSKAISAVAEFVGRRMTGDYTVDEFGFDPHLNDAVVLPLLRGLFRNWFRVEVSGIENLPLDGAALVVANHAGVLPFDGLMASVAVHDHHPRRRVLRMLAADLVFDMPMVGQAARKAGHTVQGPLQAAALRPGRVRLGGAARAGADRAVLDRRVRGDLPEDRRHQAARPGARAAVLPGHPAVPAGRAARSGPLAVQVAHQVR